MTREEYESKAKELKYLISELNHKKYETEKELKNLTKDFASSLGLKVNSKVHYKPSVACLDASLREGDYTIKKIDVGRNGDILISFKNVKYNFDFVEYATIDEVTPIN